MFSELLGDSEVVFTMRNHSPVLTLEELADSKRLHMPKRN